MLMPDWMTLWTSLTTMEMVYYAIAAISTLVAACLGLGMLLGLGLDGIGFDLGDISTGDGGGWFSMYTIVGFFLGIGWGGIWGLELGWGAANVLMISLGCGLGMFVIIAVMMRIVAGMCSDGTLRYETLVGLQGKVYVTIPPDGKTGGQVQVFHPGQLVFMSAIQKGKEPLPAGTPITVISITGDLLTVAPLDEILPEEQH